MRTNENKIYLCTVYAVFPAHKRCSKIVATVLITQEKNPALLNKETIKLTYRQGHHQGALQIVFPVEVAESHRDRSTPHCTFSCQIQLVTNSLHFQGTSSLSVVPRNSHSIQYIFNKRVFNKRNVQIRRMDCDNDKHQCDIHLVRTDQMKTFRFYRI